MADNEWNANDDDLVPIGEANVSDDDEDLEPIGETQGIQEGAPAAADDEPPWMKEPAAAVVATAAVDAAAPTAPVQTVSEDEAREVVQQAMRLIDEIRDSALLQSYLDAHAARAVESLDGGRTDEAEAMGRQVVALAEAFRTLRDLEEERRRRVDVTERAHREDLLGEIERIVKRAGGGGTPERMGPRMREIAVEVCEGAVARAAARLGKDIGNLQDSVNERARQEAAAHWTAQLDSAELTDKITGLAEAAAQEIASRESAKVRSELTAKFDKKVDATAEDLGQSLRKVDESADDLANLMREEVAKLKAAINDALATAPSGELEEVREVAERTGAVVREETKRFSRELQSVRTRSSETLADLKADIEKIRSFVREEILQLSDAVEDARRTISEKASAMDEGSVRKIVQRVMKDQA